MALQIHDITDAIGGLTITGVTVKKLDEIPETVTVSMCPILYPEPVNFISDIVPTRMTQIMSTTGWNMEYTLTYTFLYAPIGSGRGLDLISGTMITAFVAIDAIIAAVAGITDAVTFYLLGISNPGPIADPSGQQFFGVQFQFRVLEMIN